MQPPIRVTLWNERRQDRTQIAEDRIVRRV